MPRPLPPTWRADAAPSRSGSRGSVRSGRRLGEPGHREKIARAMTRVGRDKEGDVPAGYTYLGQFIDHDLTMDVTDVELGEPTSRRRELLQARSPSLDLDSLYGAGPADAGSAKFYEADGLHLKTGDTVRAGPDRVKVGHDLPRVGTGGVKAEAEGADPRPAQRREPDRRPDPPGDDPLPQPGGRQAAGVDARRRSGSAGRARR